MNIAISLWQHANQDINGDDISSFYQQTFTQSADIHEGIMVANLVKNILSATTYAWLCYIATCDDTLIGATFWTPLLLDSHQAYLLSPVAIASAHQGKGIGQKLIHHGLEYCRQQGSEFVFTYGDPNFYAKVGFVPLDDKRVIPPYPLSMPMGWLGRSLTQTPINQLITHTPAICVPAFANPQIW